MRTHRERVCGCGVLYCVSIRRWEHTQHSSAAGSDVRTPTLVSSTRTSEPHLWIAGVRGSCRSLLKLPARSLLGRKEGRQASSPDREPDMAQGLLLRGLGAGCIGLKAPPCVLLELNLFRRLGAVSSQTLESGNGACVRARRHCGTVKALVDPWAPGAAVDSQSIASSLFASSLFPYLGFLYHITKSKTSPPVTLFGFYFLLVFVAATIPAGIYAKLHYGTSLSNVDWLHGSAESLLTLTNIFIVFGLRSALRTREEESKRNEVEKMEEENVPLSK